METRLVVFITGGASGIGLQIAKDFATRGAEVTIFDNNESELQRSLNILKAMDLHVDGVFCDLTSETQINRSFEEAIAKSGRVDVLINNAGLQYISSIEDLPTEKFELLLKVMLVAPFIILKKVIPIMKRFNSGRIINMASINGLIGFAGKAAYNSAKHGLIGLTKVAALEVAPYGITVNALCPGYVDTPLVRNQLADLARIRNINPADALNELYRIIPQGRLLSVTEISNYVMFLSGKDAGGITGQAIVIDGGYTAQ